MRRYNLRISNEKGMLRKFLMPRECLICKKTFQPKQSNQKFCSAECKRKSDLYRKKIYARKYRSRLKKILIKSYKELRKAGLQGTHEIQDDLGTNCYTNLNITKHHGRLRVIGALQLERDIEKLRKREKK